MLAPCVWLSWVVILATYLRFRRAVEVQSQRSAIPSEALSPLQPYLAYFGLTMSFLLSKLHFPIALMKVIFQGYLVFARNRLPPGVSWSPTVVPWIIMGLLTVLMLGWYVHGGITKNEWDWRVPRLQKVDLHNGAAPEIVEYDYKGLSSFQKGCRWILNNI